ncbi:hypothetical protein ABZY57_10305 [Streptomyces sp. NPDC006450]|uniref:hypothetical protein n=1 Tax=Streptomyces sp. NPDC006450 TaxID=3155458 RepID=UPI0033B02E66
MPMPMPAHPARRRPDGSGLRLTGADPRFGSFAVPAVPASRAVSATPAAPAGEPEQAEAIRLGVPTGAGMAAPPAIGGARVPAADARTVLAARRRRT